MTDEELDLMEARANAATEGPWYRVDTPFGDGTFVRSGNPDCSGSFICYGEALCTELDDEEGPFRDIQADMEFVAHARTDVPALIAEVRRLRALVPTEVKDDVP